MAFAESMAPFFADLGTDAVVAGSAVRGVFDNGYEVFNGIAAGSAPTLFLSSLEASAAVGDPVTIGSQSFRVTAVEPDGTGITRLRLEAR